MGHVQRRLKHLHGHVVRINGQSILLPKQQKRLLITLSFQVFLSNPHGHHLHALQ